MATELLCKKNPIKNLTLLISIFVCTLSACKKEKFETTKYNPATEWASDFNYSDLKNFIESQYIEGIYDKQLPVGDKWTYATIQPDSSEIAHINNEFIRCHTLPESGITSKAQIARKFPPFEILQVVI